MAPKSHVEWLRTISRTLHTHTITPPGPNGKHSQRGESNEAGQRFGRFLARKPLVSDHPPLPPLRSPLPHPAPSLGRAAETLHRKASVVSSSKAHAHRTNPSSLDQKDRLVLLLRFYAPHPGPSPPLGSHPILNPPPLLHPHATCPFVGCGPPKRFMNQVQRSASHKNTYRCCDSLSLDLRPLTRPEATAPMQHASQGCLADRRCSHRRLVPNPRFEPWRRLRGAEKRGRTGINDEGSLMQATLPQPGHCSVMKLAPPPADGKGVEWGGGGVNVTTYQVLVDHN